MQLTVLSVYCVFGSRTDWSAHCPPFGFIVTAYVQRKEDAKKISPKNHQHRTGCMVPHYDQGTCEKKVVDEKSITLMHCIEDRRAVKCSEDRNRLCFDGWLSICN